MATATVIRPEAGPAPGQSPFIPGVQPPEPFTLVIFGATGDLAARKLLPALYGLWQGRFLPENFVIVGVARRSKSDDAFRADVQKAITTFRHDSRAAEGWQSFLSHVFYHQADFTAPGALQGLASHLEALEAEQKLPGNRLFYLATDPEHFEPIVEELSNAGLAHREAERPWARVVIEKPFGHDLASARELNRHVLRFLRPDQVYRIDH